MLASLDRLPCGMSPNRMIVAASAEPAVPNVTQGVCELYIVEQWMLDAERGLQFVPPSLGA